MCSWKKHILRLPLLHFISKFYITPKEIIRFIFVRSELMTLPSLGRYFHTVLCGGSQVPGLGVQAGVVLGGMQLPTMVGVRNKHPETELHLRLLRIAASICCLGWGAVSITSNVLGCRLNSHPPSLGGPFRNCIPSTFVLR